jgi:hypothetical protein
MALMHPADIDEMDGVTEGERAVFRFLQRCANPSKEWTCWAQPNVKGQEPDFLLFSVKHGLLVVEVKDWLVQQILEADTHRVILAGNGRRERRTHPDKQARGYVNTWSSPTCRYP